MSAHSKVWLCCRRNRAITMAEPPELALTLIRLRHRTSRRYFGWLADVAAVSGVTVDVLAVGVSAINVPLVGPVVAKSGGVLSIHEGDACQRKFDLPSLRACQESKVPRNACGITF